MNTILTSLVSNVLGKLRVVLLIGVCALMGCKKEEVVPQAPTTPPQATTHAIELRWTTTSLSTKRNYTYPVSMSSYVALQHRIDTVYQSTSSIKYKFEQGVPNKYNHYIEGYAYKSSVDSVEVQIWIDGVLKAKKKDQMFVSVNYNY